MLSDRTDIHFMMIGEGEKYPLIEQFVAEHAPSNLTLLPMQPNDIFPYSMACGDVGVIAQEASMAQLFMPSKTYSMMACGEAIVGICTEEDDLHALIGQQSLGGTVTDGKAETLAELIRSLADDSARTDACKKNSRECAVASYARAVIKTRYEKLFDEVFSANENTVH